MPCTSIINFVILKDGADLCVKRGDTLRSTELDQVMNKKKKMILQYLTSLVLE